MLKIIVDMGRAWFRAGDSPGSNETFLDAKPDTRDPVKHRMGTFDKGNYYGAFSGDLLVGNPEEPTRLEKVLVGLKPDDDPESREVMEHGGSFEVRCQRPNTREDGTMSPPGLRVTSRWIELFGKKVARRNDDGSVDISAFPSSANTDTIYSQNRNYELRMQNDGNLVIYRRDGSVLWASGTSE